MRRAGRTGQNRPAPTEAKKARAIPLLAEGLPYAEIARRVGVSVRTVRRWVDEDPAFSEAVARVQEAASEAVDDAAERIAGIVTASLAALAELVQSDDEKIRLEATKTALDRFGHPTRREEKQEHTGQGIGIVMAVTPDFARDAARLKKEG